MLALIIAVLKQKSSLNFPLNWFIMKLFSTFDMHIIFMLDIVLTLMNQRRLKFANKYSNDW